MNPKLKTVLFFIIGAFAGIAMMYLINPPKSSANKIGSNNVKQKIKQTVGDDKLSDKNKSIDILTAENVVIDYLKVHKKLPDYYLTKNEAKQLGWDPSTGNLCDKLPGKAIGGDNFGNREKQLPQQKGRRYFEADVNYNCGRRNADRLVFSNDGLIYITKDHYKTFQQQ